MQPMSHDNRHRHTIAPHRWAGKAQHQPNVYEEQENQWAELRHEVEVADMQWQDERVQPSWELRDTGEERFTAPSPFDMLTEPQHHVDIVVVGVGGGGMNAVNRMISAGVRGVRYVAMNTDAQVLALSEAPKRISLGQHYTKGLGAGGNAAVGMRAATESANEIRAALGNADLVFIAAGMGGGTGTGAAPVVASIAKKQGALTVGIVTLPFTFEGSRRKRIATDGIAELTTEIDALITVPNDRLLATMERDRSLTDAFKVADDVLRQGVQGIAEVINVPGMINVDFADVRSVLKEAGTALMSIGQGQGRNRAQRAADEAIAGGFLNVSIRGARRVLFNISGGEDMTLFEVNEVAERIGAAIDNTADITFGAVIDPTLTDTIRVTLIAAGMEERSTLRIPSIRMEQNRPTGSYSSFSANVPQQTPAVHRAAPVRPNFDETPLPESGPLQPTGYEQLPATEPRGKRHASDSYRQPSPPVQPDESYGQPPVQKQAVPQPPIPETQPTARRTPSQPRPVEYDVQPPERQGPTPPPRPNFAGRQMRSLDDLRGLRSMGRRQEMLRNRQTGEDADEAVDVPPYLRRSNQA